LLSSIHADFAFAPHDPMTCVAGVDFGTQSVRVSIVDHAAGVAGFGTAEYPIQRRRDDPDFATQSHAAHMTALVDAMGAALTDAGVAGSEIKALALDTTGSTVVPVGKGLQPLDDYYLWCDHRAAAEAARIYQAARGRTATDGEMVAFRRHMLFEMARMSAEDGLVMTLHPAVRRGHHAPTTAMFGPDTGHDIPLAVEFTDALRPLLDRFGTHAGFHLVLFTIDETVFSREIAPLAGFYPAVFAGAPWWFIDAPDAITRYRSSVTETAGFSRTSGFVDDTRALCSIPARHDMSRRLDSGYLARLVTEHRLDEDEALATSIELVTVNPRRAFKL